MKVLLDEFIIDRAAGGLEEQLSVISLIKGIRMKCDVTVFTPKLIAKYFKKIKKYEKRFRCQPKALKSFATLLQDSAKAKIIDQPLHVQLSQNFKEDEELVCAAIACGAEKMLITTDKDLMTKLHEESIATKHRIKVVQPEEAMEKRGYTSLLE